jgi:hypothetical protein
MLAHGDIWIGEGVTVIGRRSAGFAPVQRGGLSWTRTVVHVVHAGDCVGLAGFAGRGFLALDSVHSVHRASWTQRTTSPVTGPVTRGLLAANGGAGRAICRVFFRRIR